MTNHPAGGPLYRVAEIVVLLYLKTRCTTAYQKTHPRGLTVSRRPSARVVPSCDVVDPYSNGDIGVRESFLVGALSSVGAHTWRAVRGLLLRSLCNHHPLGPAASASTTPPVGNAVIGHSTGALVAACAATFIVAVLALLLVVALTIGLVLAVMLVV